ncbi:MAG TPA: response regulator [Roseiflexaceae bacterium]|nr:response regulator [Roseiflexaceae bacterium]
MNIPLRVLMVEDSQDDALLVARALRRGAYDPQITRVQSADALCAALDRQTWDVIIADHRLPGFSGLDALALVQQRGLDVPFIVVSGSIGEEIAVASMRAGAQDYVMKDNLARLAPAIERELREVAGRRERRRAEQERQTVEAQFRQAQKMDLVGQLAGGIAHDFNNLLTAITGYAELALQSIPGDEPAREDVEEILRASQRASALTRQLLTFSRRQLAEPQVIDLRELVTDLGRMLRRLLGAEISLSMSADNDLWPVRADPGQIEQILVNLAVNARDAMPGGGELTITLHNQGLQAQELGGRSSTEGALVALTVSDTGVGMSSEVRARLFEPFFTTKPHGTGLGLTICETIVRQNGGRILVESSSGHGSSIAVLLPRADEPAASQGETAPDALPYGNEQILLVDDEPTICALAARVLRAQGYSVLEATSPEEALHLAESDHPPQLLLASLIMPRISGRALADRLKAIHPELRVLFTCGSSDTALAQNDPILPKPFSRAALTRKVREVLDGS